MGRGVAFQKADFSESRCTDYIPKSFPFNGRLRGIGAVEPIISQAHSERQLFTFEGSQRTAASDFGHRRLWARRSQPTKPSLNGSNLIGPASGYSVVSRPLSVSSKHRLTGLQAAEFELVQRKIRSLKLTWRFFARARPSKNPEAGSFSAISVPPHFSRRDRASKAATNLTGRSAVSLRLHGFGARDG